MTPVYAGNYAETLTKAVTALRGGGGPQLAVLLAAEMHSLQDMDILVALDEIGLDADGQALDRRLLSRPSWRTATPTARSGRCRSSARPRSSTTTRPPSPRPGSIPTRYPTTWAELAAAAEKLTARDGSGRVTRWGIKLAGDLGNAQWTFGALANQADHMLMNEAGTEVYFNHPKAIEALAFWRSLAAAHQATPEGISAWPQLSPDFLAGNAAIIQHTTGNLTNVRNKANFPFGVAGLPGKDGPRTVVGGGNLYFFKSASPAERAAALRFARFLSAPERAADWSIRTGYIATSPAAYETPALKDYVAEFPAGRRGARLPAGGGGRAVHLREPARLQGADRPDPGLPERHQDAGAGDGGRAGRGRPGAEAVPAGICAPSPVPLPKGRGSKFSPLPLREGVGGRGHAHRNVACRAMKRETLHAWLLVLPALVLLVAFTHWPALTTLLDSLYTTPEGQPAGAVRRARQLRRRCWATRCSGRRCTTTRSMRSPPFRPRWCWRC